MNFTITWYNNKKGMYDNYYLPTDYLTLNKCRLTNNYNYCDYIDIELSPSQLHSYKNGYNLLEQIFNNLTEEQLNWIRNNNKLVDFSKYKSLVNKVRIK